MGRRTPPVLVTDAPLIHSRDLLTSPPWARSWSHQSIGCFSIQKEVNVFANILCWAQISFKDLSPIRHHNGKELSTNVQIKHFKKQWEEIQSLFQFSAGDGTELAVPESWEKG